MTTTTETQTPPSFDRNLEIELSLTEGELYEAQQKARRWEAIAIQERQVTQSLAGRVAELEAQLPAVEGEVVDG